MHNDKVTFGDTAEFNSKVIFNQLPQLPLPKGNIWVGDSLGYADSVAPRCEWYSIAHREWYSDLGKLE
ncbi:MAG: hypothetical protein IPK11_11265 [Ignavibacteria bacterium]|nr:hypothetical protein [Ignavibacteria bacterium]